MRSFSRLLCFMVCLIACGCGYSTRPSVVPGVSRIYVETFKNNVYQPNLETEVTTEIIGAFIKDGYYRIVKREEADAIISGEIITYVKQPVRYDIDENIQEYRLSIAVNMKFWNTRKDALIWEEKNFVGEATYFLSGAAAKTEQTARTEAVRDLAKRVLNRTIEGW